MEDHNRVSKVEENLVRKLRLSCGLELVRGPGDRIVTSDLQHCPVRFTNGQTLTIQAANYRGETFLAFDPYKPR